jgi:hypothetical protein
MLRYLAILLIAVTLLSAGATQVHADRPPLEPIVLIAGASYQQVSEDLAYLGSTIQNDQFPRLVGRLLQAATGIEELEGLGKRRRWGAVVSTDGITIAPLAFVPITDLDALLESLGPRIGTAVKGDDGYYTLGQGAKTLIAVQEGDWAFIGQSRDVLAHRPNPAELLAGISEQYDLAVQLYVQRIPEVFRTLAIDQVRLALRDSLQAAPSETAGQFALRKQRMALQFGALEQLFAETEQITAGWALDRAAKRTYFELAVQPVSGGKLAQRIEAARDAETVLSGLIDAQAPISAHLSQQLDAQQVEGALAQAAAYRAAALARFAPQAGSDSDAACDECRALVEQLFETVDHTIKSGRVEMALRLTGESPSTLVAAARIAGGTALRERLENWAEQSRDTARPSPLRLQAAQMQGAPIHAWSIPAGDRIAPLLDRLCGTDRTLYVAILPDTIWLAVGDRAVTAMQQAAASAPRAAAPAEATVKLGTIVSLAAQSSQNPRLQGVLSLAGLNLRTTDDRVSFRIESSSGVCRVRLEAHEGVVRALALAATLAIAQAAK